MTINCGPQNSQVWLSMTGPLWACRAASIAGGRSILVRDRLMDHRPAYSVNETLAIRSRNDASPTASQSSERLCEIDKRTPAMFGIFARWCAACAPNAVKGR